MATSVFDSVQAAVDAELGYSYQQCGAPDCCTDTDAAGCPCNWDGTCCECLYKDGLPESVWQGGDYEDLAMISQHGAQCAPWGCLEGTPWFAGYCDTDAGKDWCSSSDSWCNDPWCLVDKDRCNTWVSSSVFPGVTDLGYSYDLCGSLNCYSTPNDDGWPCDLSGECETCENAGATTPAASATPEASTTTPAASATPEASATPMGDSEGDGDVSGAESPAAHSVLLALTAAGVAMVLRQ